MYLELTSCRCCDNSGVGSDSAARVKLCEGTSSAGTLQEQFEAVEFGDDGICCG